MDGGESMPLERAVAMPPGFYLGADMLAQDRAPVFGRSWQLVAHRDELLGAGDHVVTQIAAVPVLVVRGDDRVLRALASGFYEPGQLSPRHEAGVWHFHRLLHAAYARPKVNTT